MVNLLAEITFGDSNSSLLNQRTANQSFLPSKHIAQTRADLGRVVKNYVAPLWIEAGQPCFTLSRNITKPTTVHVTFVVRAVIKVESKSAVFVSSESVHILTLCVP
jgi:hypothetical protein